MIDHGAIRMIRMIRKTFVLDAQRGAGIDHERRTIGPSLRSG